MVQATLSPELARQSIALARALSSASRNWGLYPPEHPAVEASVKRLADAINRSVAGAVFTFGVTPKTLMVAGYPLPEEQSVTDAARLMHDHDILQMTFVGEPDTATLHALLALLQRPADELRAGGGPAKVWQKTRQATVALEQIDYEKILEDRNIDHALEHREDIWRSGTYQASLEGAVGRSELFSTRDLPPELPEWVESLRQDNVRALSVLLITDLLRIEENEARAADIATDMAALADDLLLSGDFANSALVLGELRKASERTIAPKAMRAALTTVGESIALREAASMLTDFDEATLNTFAACCKSIGPIAIRSLHPALQSETETLDYVRARDITQGFGKAGISFIVPLADDNRWFVQRHAASLLGATTSLDAVPTLQGLLRRSDPRVLRQAVAALAGIEESAAARALQTALRAASGAARTAVVDALVAEKDLRVVPMLTRILAESDPFGEDHQTVLDSLDAVRQLADDRATPAVATLLHRKKFFSRKRTRALKLAAAQALLGIGSSRARSTLDEAGRSGDRMLKTAVREARGAA
jgi:HEAT repeat protein